MGIKRRYDITKAGMNADMEKLTTSERLILMTLRAARYECDEMPTRDMIKKIGGIPDSTFDRSWKRLMQLGYVTNAALTKRGEEVSRLPEE